MFTIINGLPKDTLGILISGKTTKEDYERLNPLLETHKKNHEKIKMLVEVKDFNYSAGALWEDLKFSFNYLGSISAIAIVTEKEWLEESMETFGKVWPNLNVEGFEFEEQKKALDWLKKQKV
ncbi:MULTISPECIES: STAS/SEC14 domain-containing protein [Aequorivita]|uniref:STAS/SEC14 domain-containing protein n=1 Tax=Aequorivita iocasae TaxID=2803865 RepID=A0ABX7DPF2_9FLAO|nr:MULTISPECIES: STAS/SEC14 domain-containing protein [Aequorivita]QQX75398.1 STAS/SEC14 domain-containing protein [Aequorivita iocasae]UCA54848.1 STAS/SEC14 domain-containing protein [Aequorivita sp. F7]